MKHKLLQTIEAAAAAAISGAIAAIPVDEESLAALLAHPRSVIPKVGIGAALGLLLLFRQRYGTRPINRPE